MRIHPRFPAFGVLVAVLLHVLPATAQDNVVWLDGHNLLFDDVVHVAVGGLSSEDCTVGIGSDAEVV
jgi:hypothetical protein